MRKIVNLIISLTFGLGVGFFTVNPLLALIQIPTITLGQAVNCTVGWDQQGGTLSEVSSYRYDAFIDGSTAPLTVATSCSGASSPFLCQTPLPAKTVGTHTVSIQPTASDGTIGGVSAVFTYKITGNPPLAPANLRLIVK